MTVTLIYPTLIYPFLSATSPLEYCHLMVAADVVILSEKSKLPARYVYHASVGNSLDLYMFDLVINFCFTLHYIYHTLRQQIKLRDKKEASRSIIGMEATG